MNQYKIFLIVGARPNFMKIAPLFRCLQNKEKQFDTKIVHTGQHYDYEMSQVFFEQLGMVEPDYFLDVGSGSHAVQTARVMVKFEKLVGENRPDLVVVVGDVNSTLAASIVCAKCGIPLAHIEAGLRSFDRAMPEEINRVLTDRIADLLFASEPSGVKNLINEGAAEKKIHLCGNLMIDSLAYHLPQIKQNDIIEKMGLKGQEFGLVTLHRPSNVDNKETLAHVLKILRKAASRGNVVWPLHPRTAANMKSFGLEKDFRGIDNLIIVDPLGYFEFMNLMMNSAYLLTDSGGIQEETTWLGVPCITLRENTERPLTVDEGTNRITGLDITAIINALEWAANFDPSSYTPPELWDGKAASRVVNVLEDFLEQSLKGNAV
jgi:UDP-N-acetylglucosamine 2-epimerase (non-hydrolysing)